MSNLQLLPKINKNNEQKEIKLITLYQTKSSEQTHLSLEQTTEKDLFLKAFCFPLHKPVSDRVMSDLLPCITVLK